MRFRHRWYLRRSRGQALAYRKDSRGRVRTLAGHLVSITFSYPDAVDAERERAGEDRNWVPPLVRDRKTLRAMERPAGPAGTRAWHKQLLAAIMGKIDCETIMTRTRLAVQRVEAVARLRKFSKPALRHLMRYAEVWARDVERDNDHDKTRTWRDYYPACLDAIFEGDYCANVW